MRLFDSVKIEESSGNVFADLGLPRADETLNLADRFSRKRNGRKLFMAAVLALTGCATTQTKYVSTYCLSHDQQLPAEPERVKSKLTGQADKDLTIIAGSAIRLRAYGEGLRTILEGCREPTTGAAASQR